MTEINTKQCPYCGEEIKAVAVKCRFCQSMLSSTVPPPGTDPGGGTSPPLYGGTPAPGMGPEWWHLSGPLQPGVKIREYLIERMLGQGGMGEVYLAMDVETGRRVAIKVVSPVFMRDAGIRRRFQEEATVMASLKHPNIITLYTFFEEGNRFFLVMEYIEGESLEEQLERGYLEYEEAKRISAGVLAALRYAHSRSDPVVHRDIKPANILLGKDGQVVVIDFGIARALGRERLTKMGRAVGTYEYMSPEQIQSQDVSPASDYYSLGVTMYKMLTGIVPFPQRTETGVNCMEGHLRKQPPALAEFREGIPTQLSETVLCLLRKNPQDRYVGEQLASQRNLSEDYSIPIGNKFEQEESVSTVSTFPLKLLMLGVLALVVIAGIALFVFSGRKEGTDPIDGNLPDIRSDSKVCIPACKDRNCGDNGCGGKCGDCVDGHTCQDGQCLCQPDCSNRDCGDDGCGGSCGECTAAREECREGQCRCVPHCADRECGDDGCNGSCGKCLNSQEKCSNGKCNCLPACDSKECGPDGCGADCGTCPAGNRCDAGRCRLDLSSLREMTIPSHQLRLTSSESRAPVRSKGGGKLYTYGPEKLVDGDTESAWIEGESGHADHAWIKLSFGKTLILDKVNIWSGYQKIRTDAAGDRFYGNDRPRDIVVRTENWQQNTRLKDQKGMQNIAIGGQQTSWVTIEIRSVYEGKNTDCAISEIEAVALVQ